MGGSSSGSTPSLINEDSFLDFLKEAHGKFGRLYLFLDKARQHYSRSRKVLRYLDGNRSTVRVRWFPTASPELNVVEECWRQAGGRRTTSSRPDTTHPSRT